MQTPGVAPAFYPAHQANPDLALRTGQMVFGKVHKIYPNQTADITIGNVKITARLDAPISMGEGYWFQVKRGGDAAELKVLRTENATTAKAAPLQVLAHLSLPPSKENIELAKMFIENQLPITKENILQSVKWAAESKDRASAFQAVKTIHSLSLPLTDKVFQAIASFENKMPLQHAITNLLTGLNDGVSETETSLKAVLSHLLAPSAEKAADSGIRKLMNAWLSFDGTLKDQSYRMLQTIGIFPKNTSQNSALLQALNQLSNQGGLVMEMGMQNALRQLTEAMNSGPGQTANLKALTMFKQVVEGQIRETPAPTKEGLMWREIGKLLGQAPRRDAAEPKLNAYPEHNHPLNSSLVGMKAAGKTNEGMEAILFNTARKLLQYALSSFQVPGGSVSMIKSINPGIQTDAVKQLLNHVLQQQIGYGDPSPSSQSGEIQFLQKVMQEEAKAIQAPLQSVLSSDLKAAIKLMGFGFEHYLANLDNSSLLKENELRALKPLLIKWMSENASSPYREQAEMVTNKITGQQLLSQSSGPIQHFLVQIPFPLGQHRTDVTFQWSGRKKKDGKIDSSYCRVLFYLQLENIHDTVIDMAVQNKVVKVTVNNLLADMVKEAAKPYMEQLKSGLEGAGYRLSSVVFEKPAPSGLPVQAEAALTQAFGPTSYSGVDIKI